MNGTSGDNGEEAVRYCALTFLNQSSQSTVHSLDNYAMALSSFLTSLHLLG
jgi:hypothetical protein